MTPEGSKRRLPEPVPRHLRATTLHGVVLALWVAVGVFTGLGLVATIGAFQLADDAGLSLLEQVAAVGEHAGPWFVAGTVALGAIAVVEVLLLALGHVRYVDPEAPDAEAVAPVD